MMKITPELFADLYHAIRAIYREGQVSVPATMRERWDFFWISGFKISRLYDAGLNDDHIDTALRRVFKHLADGTAPALPHEGSTS